MEWRDPRTRRFSQQRDAARGAAAAFLVSVSLLAPAVPLGASVVLRTSLDEMLADCALVFEGTVVEVWTESSRGRLHTWVRFRVDERIKGAAPAMLALRFRGGRIGDVIETVAGSPIPEPGDRGIYFVESVDRFLVNPLYGWEQGLVRVLRTADGSNRVYTSRRHPIVAVEVPAAPTEPAARAQAREGIVTSTGVALGIRADARAPPAQALRVEDFEAALAARLGAVR